MPAHVQGQKHFLDIRHDAVGEYQGQVTRHGILQGGNQVVAAEALLRGPASSLEAVSYTHLDVYKRQLRMFVKFSYGNQIHD